MVPCLRGGWHEEATMEKKVVRKLTLQKDTIRALTGSDLSEAQGRELCPHTVSLPSTCICIDTQQSQTCGTCC